MWATLVYATVALIVLRLIYEARRDHKLPPGPRRLPFIGNLHQAPTSTPWRTYHKWFQQYGPLISLQFGGTTVIIIGSASAAHDLLDTRGNIYADRPRLVMAGECLTKGMHILLRPYDERFVLHKRMDAPVLSPRASATYFPLQDLESKQLLAAMVKSAEERPGAPVDFHHRFELFAYSVVYMAAYGIRITADDEAHMHDAKHILDNFAYAAQVGTWIVDALPFLNKLPKGPLAPWKRTAEELYEIESSLHARNTATALASKNWNWTKELKKSKEAKEMSPLEFAYNVGALVDAGLETTSTVMDVFVLACLAHPAFIRRAQKEMDEVVGKDRLPSFADRDGLPYVRAVVEETLRWRHIAPGGVPHATLQEDHYMGYRIPKGATVLPAFWTMHLDEEVYDSPWAFRPERWLGIPEARHFGYGRRVCTGRFIARNSLFILIARLLWTFDIRHAVDKKTGKRIEVDDIAFGSGFVSKPDPFPAVFKPRSDRHQEVVEKEWGKQEKDVNVLLNGIRDHQIAVGLNVRATA
ncbi:hypothetical protein SLS56_007867 [Neofusicoccum ribis]|uniref:Cytochrome P450 n=1 Tax=Neofusicoccum ribis TaxID=45134 RepID=A0ABR3SLQ6_9PEZI